MGEQILLPAGVLPAFGGGRVAPYQFAVTGEDSLLVRMTTTLDALTAGPTPLSVAVRLLLPDGTIQVNNFLLPWDGVSTMPQILIPLPPSAITNISARYAGGPWPNGAMYVSVYVVRGNSLASFTITGQLLGGLVTSGKSLSYPGSAITPWTEGRGWTKDLSPGFLPLGTEMAFALGAPPIWRLIAFTGTLTCSAAAATRYPTIILGPGGGVIWYRSPLIATLAAGQSGEFNWAIGYGTQMAAVPPRYYGPLADLGLLNPLAFLSTNTIGLQAGDQWSNITMWVEERVLPKDT